MTHELAKLILLLGVSALAIDGLADDSGDRYVTVYGTAEAWIEPDLAVWDVTIATSGKTLSDLHADNGAELIRVVDVARGLGLSDDQIAAGRVNVQKYDKKDKHGNRKGFSHFTVRRKISLEVRDLDRLGDLMTGILDDGDLDARLVWRASAVDSVRHTLKLQAVCHARDKAAAMAAELDAQVGPPLIISEWPIITDVQTVDHLSREAGLSYRIKPERIRVREKAYVRFELHMNPAAAADQ